MQNQLKKDVPLLNLQMTSTSQVKLMMEMITHILVKFKLLLVIVIQISLNWMFQILKNW